MLLCLMFKLKTIPWLKTFSLWCLNWFKITIWNTDHEWKLKWIIFYHFSSVFFNLFIDPLHERAQGNVAFFGEEMKMYKQTGRRGDTGIITDTKVKPRSERDNWHRTSSFQNYEKLCRGEVRNLVSRFEEQKWLLS